MAAIPSQLMSQNTLPPVDSHLLTEVRDLNFTIRLMGSVVTGVAALLGYGIVSAFPQFEALFTDLYGDRRLLPKLTYAVLSWAHSGDGLMVIAFLCLLAGIGSILPWFVRRAKFALVLSSGAGVLLILHGFLCCAAMFVGFMRVFKGLAAAI
jgi:hypothetical protein